MFRALIIALLPFTLLCQELELRTRTQDENLYGLVVAAMKAKDLVVVDSVKKNKGFVIYWGTPNDAGTQLDEITIYDYKTSPHPNTGAVQYHNQVPLRAHYVLKWTRNEKLNKVKQIELLSQLIQSFCRETWPEPKAVVVTDLHIERDLNPDLKNSLQVIRQDPLSVKAYVSVSATDLKDNHVIREYTISRITKDLTASLQVMGKSEIGLTGRLEVLRYTNGAPIDAAQIATVAELIMATDLK